MSEATFSSGGPPSPREEVRDPDRSHAGETVFDVLLLLATAWVCHFLQASHFGLYEDDWWRVPLVADASFAGLWSLLTDFFLFRVGQGRPLADGLIYLFSFLGWRLGGIEAIYWIAYAIFALNSALVYMFLKRLSGGRFVALTGALAFIVFPADTTREFLTHALCVQPSLTFLLLAFFAYLSGRRALSYILALGCLLTYETFFPIFLCIPLSESRWDRRILLGLVKHALTLGAILFAVVVLRELTGEERVGGLTASGLLVGSTRAMVLGPLVSMGQFFRGPISHFLGAQGGFSWEEASVVLGCFALFTWRLSRHLRETGIENEPLTKVIVSPLLHLELPRKLFEIGKLAVLSVPMLILAYPLALTVSPLATSGRDSRVHSAAAVGAALAFGAVASAVVTVFGLYRLQRLAAVAVGAGLALMASFAYSVQSDYRLAWTLQREFWTRFVQLSPAMNEGTVFLLDPGEDTQRISAYSWSTSVVLEQIYDFPESWRSPEASVHPAREAALLPPPRVFMLKEPWQGPHCAGPELLVSSGWIARNSPSSLIAQYSATTPRVRWIHRNGDELSLVESECSLAPGRSEAQAASKLSDFERKPMYAYLVR